MQEPIFGECDVQGGGWVISYLVSKFIGGATNYTFFCSLFDTEVSMQRLDCMQLSSGGDSLAHAAGMNLLI